MGGFPGAPAISRDAYRVQPGAGVEGIGKGGHQIELLDGLQHIRRTDSGLQRIAPFDMQPLEIGFLDRLRVKIAAIGHSGAIVAPLKNTAPHKGLGHSVGQRVFRGWQSGIPRRYEHRTALAGVGLVGSAASMARFAEMTAHSP